jgi:hypothetical protein
MDIIPIGIASRTTYPERVHSSSRFEAWGLLRLYDESCGAGAVKATTGGSPLERLMETLASK